MIIYNVIEQSLFEISEGNFEQALLSLVQLKEVPDDLKSNIYLLSGRYHDLQKDKIKGIVGISDEKLLQNQIINSTLDVIKYIKKLKINEGGNKERIAELSYKIGNEILHLKNYQIAIEYFNSVIETEGVSIILKIKALNDRGASKLANGDFELAVEDFSKAIQLQSHEAISHYNRGIAFLKLAERDFKNATLLGYEPAREYCQIFNS